MPSFEVGEGIKAEMARRGDTPVADSAFFIPRPGLTLEVGHGRDRLYLWDNFNGEGRLIVKPHTAGLLPPPPPPYTSMIAKLPVRAGSSPYPMRLGTAITLFVVHYTAGPPTSTVQAIASYQTGPTSHLSFPAIAYHWYVEGDGALYVCHEMERRTWGSDGRFHGQVINDIAVHCCYAGNDRPNPAQIMAIRAARVETEAMIGRALTVRGHRDDDATACPGASWSEWKDQI